MSTKEGNTVAIEAKIPETEAWQEARLARKAERLSSGKAEDLREEKIAEQRQDRPLWKGDRVPELILEAPRSTIHEAMIAVIASAERSTVSDWLGIPSPRSEDASESIAAANGVAKRVSSEIIELLREGMELKTRSASEAETMHRTSISVAALIWRVASHAVERIKAWTRRDETEPFEQAQRLREVSQGVAKGP